VNPVEWAEWIYGKWFIGQPVRGYFVIVGFVTLLIWVVFTIVWFRAVDAYNENHPDLGIEQQAKLAASLDESQRQLHAAEQELSRLIAQLPPTSLSAERQAALVDRLKQLPPGVATVLFLDLPIARARPLADSITEAFRATGWRVRLIGVVKNYESTAGVSQHVEDEKHIKPTQKGVRDALNAAGLNVGSWHGGPPSGFTDQDLVGDYILLIVGRQ
jgi:hypothetical protein